MQLRNSGAALIAFGLICTAVRADITGPLATPPPQADAVSVRVERGAQKTIELRGHYGQSGVASFWIVRPPAHGKLSALHTGGDNVATIVYQQDGNRDFATDDFSYIVQAGGRVSAEAEVKIAIDEPAPRLHVPPSLDFGEIKAGESAARSLTIANEGGGTLQGRLTISNPWTLAQPEYQVGASAAAAVAVTFAPNEPGDFVGQIALNPLAGAAKTVALSGRAIAPVRIAPDPLSMGAERKATVFLTNLTDRTLILNFKTGPDFKPIESLELPAKQDGDITVEILPEVHAAIHETIAIVGVHFSLRLPVNASVAETKSAVQNPVASKPLPALRATASPAPSATASPAEKILADETLPSSNETETTAPTNPAAKISARRLNSSSWELRWAAAKIAGATYRVEERKLALAAKDELQISWQELTPAKIDVGHDPIVADFDHLDGRALHILRVSALEADGKILWQSPLVSLAPEPVASHGGTYLFLLLAAALATLAYVRWRAGRLA